MKLYYNDYNTDNSNKADGIVRTCAPIYKAGYLDGIGLQGHEGTDHPSASGWIDMYNKFDKICNEMSITEYYVDQRTTSPNTTTLTAQANQYAMLFKLFVERSYYSGRGKIINLTKDGLNDQYTLFPNTYSSLWDAQNKCKPAFYAVVEVGKNYNSLDSLITFANLLKEKDYTSASWSVFVSSLNKAKQTKAQNYSVSVSAATALSDANNNLKTGIDGLVKITNIIADFNDINQKVFKLNQKYPNPFNPTTKISYSIPKKEFTTLKLYNPIGEEVAKISSGIEEAGYHTVSFHRSNLVSGFYFYKLKSGNFIDTKKLLLLK
jgi:hypothetical protein